MLFINYFINKYTINFDYETRFVVGTTGKMMNN